jgi:cathepsin L
MQKRVIVLVGVLLMMSVMMAAKIEDVDDNFENYQKKQGKTYAS